MPLKEKDEALAEAMKSLARLREKRYYCLKDFERRKFNIWQECRAELHDLEEKYEKWFREINSGVDPKTASEILGQNVKTTLDTYVHPALESFKRPLNERAARVM